MFFMFLKHQLIDIIPRWTFFMCFFKLRLQSFLERKSREATCFPSHGDWLNTVTQSRRTGEPENSRGAHNCTVVTPPPGLKCVTSSEFEHNVVQCAWSQLPVGEYNVASMSVTREHGGNKRHCFPLSDQLRIPFNFVAIFPMCGPHHIFSSLIVFDTRGFSATGERERWRKGLDWPGV